MRHFIVLGFTTQSKNDQGKSLYLGTDRQKAVDKVNEQSGKYVRRELYDLAMPHMRRHFPAAAAEDDGEKGKGSIPDPGTPADPSGPVDPAAAGGDGGGE